MAGIRDLITNYLRQAEAEGHTTVDEKIAWLETKREALWTEVEAGDWAVKSGSFAGQSHSSDREITNRELLEAVNAALDKLKREGSSGCGMIQPRFYNAPL